MPEPTVTPGQPGAADPQPSEVEQLRTEIANLTSTIEELKKDTTTKDQTITELANSKSALEQRLNELEAIKYDVAGGQQPTGPVPGVDAETSSKITAIMESATMDPAKAGQDLAKLLQENKNASTQEAINAAISSVTKYTELNDYLNKVKAENPDLMPFEAMITARASAIMAGGKGLKEAVDTAIAETKSSLEARDDHIKNNAEPPNLPPGAKVEDRPGAPAPAPEPETPETPEQHVGKRKDSQQSKVL